MRTNTSLTDTPAELQPLSPPVGSDGHSGTNSGRPLDYRRLFELFGVYSGDPNGTGEAVSDGCPWCGVGTFLLDTLTGRYRCLGCNEQGNVHNFIRRVHKGCLEVTTDDDYHRLQGKRGLRAETFKRHGLAWHGGLGCWLVPYHSKQGQVLNITRYYPVTGDKVTLPILPLRLFGLDRLAPVTDPTSRTLFVVEGPFDLLALDQQLRDRKTRQRFDILAVPAAGVFKPQWLRYLRGRTVRLCLDHDLAGRNGQERIARLVRDNDINCDLFALRWPPGHPPKCDVGDLVRDGVIVEKFTREHCVPVAALGKGVARV